MEDNLLSLSFGRIIRKNIDDSDGLLPASFETYQIVEPNMLVFRFTDLQNDKRSLRSARVTERGIITSAYTAAQPTGINSRYADYLMRAYDTSKVFYSLGGGVRQSLKFSDVARLPILLPPEPEQHAIVDYLDRETAKIDTLIEEQQRLIDLLRERRRAICTRLATTGVHASSSLGETDLPWATQLPMDWTVVPLTSVTRLTSGHTPSRSRPELWEDCHIPWVSLNDVGGLSKNEYITETTNLISDAGIEASAAEVHPAGTVILSRDATIGRSSIMRIPMATSQHFADWICGPRISPRYLWLLFTSAMQPYFDSLTNGSTIRTIGMGLLKGFKIPLPPLDEQEGIAEEAAAQTERINCLIAEAERFIDLARERRAALITAAVTGQIDVRKEVA